MATGKARMKEVGLLTNFEVLAFIRAERENEDEARRADGGGAGAGGGGGGRGKGGRGGGGGKPAVPQNEQMDALDKQVLWQLERTVAATQTTDKVRAILKAAKDLGLELREEERLQLVNTMPQTEVEFQLVRSFGGKVIAWMVDGGGVGGGGTGASSIVGGVWVWVDVAKACPQKGKSQVGEQACLRKVPPTDRGPKCQRTQSMWYVGYACKRLAMFTPLVVMAVRVVLRF